MGHCTELQMEIVTTRRELEAAKGNVSSLEAEVLAWYFFIVLDSV